MSSFDTFGFIDSVSNANPNEDSHESQSNFGIIVLTRTAEHQGYLSYFEIFPSSLGLIHIQVLRPVSNSNYLFEMVYKFTAKITDTSNWVQFKTDAISIFPGDLIAFVSGTDESSCWPAVQGIHSNEYLVIGINSSSNSTHDITDGIVIRKSYMIRAVVIRNSFSSVPMNYFYKKSGNYDVSVKLLSISSKFVKLEYNVTVEDTLQLINVQITSDEHLESMKYFFVYVKSYVQYSIHADFGDGQEENVVVSNLTGFSMNTSVSHNFMKSGFYHVKFTVSEFALSRNSNEAATYFENNVTVSLLAPSNITHIIMEVGEKKNDLRIDEIYIIQTSADIKFIIMDIGMAGNTNICIHGISNGTSGSSFCFKLRLIQQIEAVAVLLSGNEVFKGENFSITVYPIPSIADVCILVHDDFSQHILAYGSKEICRLSQQTMFELLLFRTDQLSLNAMRDPYSDKYISSTLFYQFMMLKFENLPLKSYPKTINYAINYVGTTYLNVLTFNGLSYRSKVHTMTVYEATECYGPEVQIKSENSENIGEKGFIFNQFQSFTLIGVIKINCNFTNETIKSWKLHLIDLNGINTKELLPNSVEKSKSIIEIEKGLLPEGKYRVTFDVQVIGKKIPKSRVFNNSVSALIHIKGSPLIAKLIPGDASVIELGIDSKITLSPKFYSTFQLPIKVYIHGYVDVFQMSLHLMHLTDLLLLNISHPITDNLVTKNTTDLGGCFGSGPGRVAITKGEWTIYPSMFIKINTLYEIMIVIESNGLLSHRAVQILFKDQKQPTPNMKCQNPELCHALVLGHMVNPERLGFLSMCLYDCNEIDILSRKWILSYKQNGIYKEIIDDSEYLTRNNESAIAIKSSAFDFLPGINELKLTLQLTTRTGIGKSHMLLTVNKLPQKGRCFISSSIGYALIEDFTVSCFGWIDLDPDDFISSYEYWVSPLNSDHQDLLIVGGGPTEVLRLPYGSYNLGVNIFDSSEGYTSHMIGKVSLLAPSVKDYEEFMANELPLMKAEGNQPMLNMIASSAISLFQNVYGAPSAFLALRNEDRISMDPLKNEKILKESVKEIETKRFLLNTINDNINSDSLKNLQLFGTSMTSVVGTGETIDEATKSVCLKMLEKMIKGASAVDFKSPQQAIKMVGYIAGTVGALINRLSDQIVSKRFLPTDVQLAEMLDYPVDNPIPGDYLEGNILDFELSEEQLLQELIFINTLKQSEEFVAKLLNQTDELIKLLVAPYMVENEVVHIKTKSNVQLTYGKFQLWQLSGLKIEHAGSSVIFPNSCSMFPTWKHCTGNETVLMMAITYPSILQSYGKYVDLLENKTSTQQLRLYDEHFQELDVSNTSEPIEIMILKRNAQRLDVEEEKPMKQLITPFVRRFEKMSYHEFKVVQPGSAFFIEIQPLTVNYGQKLFIKNKDGKYKPGKYYLGVAEIDSSLPFANISQIDLKRNFSSNYTLLILTSSCYFFNSKSKAWTTSGCYVDSLSVSSTSCKCNHLTSFARGFVIVPNTIDFTYVFSHSGFTDNITIYVTIIVILFFFTIMFIWARRNDKIDSEKLGSIPLPDNRFQDIFIYEVMVITGSRKEAGTDSKVKFILAGDLHDSGERTFGETNRKIFRTGGRDAFLMTVPSSLGKLSYIRIWHDNSGEGKFASWYLNTIIVKDIQTNKKMYFIANRWFAVEKDTGEIDHMIPVASKQEIQQFKYKFHEMSQKSMADEHVWLSVFTRPPRSRFSRVERVSCCMVILTISMVVGAMWYEKTPSKPMTGMKFGPFSISMEELGIGIISNLIEFPLSFIIIFFFRQSRRRNLRPSRFHDILINIRSAFIHGSLQPKLKAWVGSISKPVEIKSQTNSNIIERFKSNRPILLPWWCRNIAWLLVFVTITGSLFIVWAYGITFGNEKTSKWLTSIVVSVLASITFTQPVKVFLVSILLSLVCRSIDSDHDDADDDEEQPELLEEEKYLHYNHVKLVKRRFNMNRENLTRKYQQKLTKARRTRFKDMMMWQILGRILAYLLFLFIILILSYGNRDPNAFYLRQSLKNNFIKEGDLFNDFNKVSSVERFWNWTRKALIPELRVGRWYNGNQPFGLRGFLNDRVSKLMGYAVIRQVRIQPENCNNASDTKLFHPGCEGYSSIVKENINGNDSMWRYTGNMADEYRYRSPEDLQGYPIIAKLDYYSGGGYIYKLRGSRKHLVSEMFRLQNSFWIDKRTRAVFVEFSIYNAQANLFGVVNIIVEILPGGGFIPSYRFEVVTLLRYHRGFGLFVIISEIFTVLVILLCTGREIRFMYLQKLKYFADSWNKIEILNLLLSYAAISCYIYRYVVTQEIIQTFSKSHGNDYIKLQSVAIIDEFFGYFMSFVIFISILKISRLTQFNKRMNMLHQTLHQLRHDLSNYSIIFLIIFLAFVLLFYLIFGCSASGFSNIISAMETTGSVMLGKFDYQEFYRSSPFLGPVLFFVFSISSKFVIINLLMTLIITAFEQVKNNGQQTSFNEYQIVDFIWKKLVSWIGFSSMSSSKPLLITSQADKFRKPTNVQNKICIKNINKKMKKLVNYVDKIYVNH
ncbi:Location of vulva defective 1 [Nymphon striatum]|nr:Location of vulva defective 1 [Nymphon striatum]